MCAMIVCNDCVPAVPVSFGDLAPVCERTRNTKRINRPYSLPPYPIPFFFSLSFSLILTALFQMPRRHTLFATRSRADGIDTPPLFILASAAYLDARTHRIIQIVLNLPSNSFIRAFYILYSIIHYLTK